MNVDRDLLPMREAAAVLGVTQDSIRARIRRGTIEARKESGRWMVAVPADVQDAARDTTATDVDAAGPHPRPWKRTPRRCARKSRRNAS